MFYVVVICQWTLGLSRRHHFCKTFCYTTTPTFKCSHLVPFKLCISCKQPAGVCNFSPIYCLVSSAPVLTLTCELLFEPTVHICDELNWILNASIAIPISKRFQKNEISSPFGLSIFRMISSKKFWPLAFKCHQSLREMFFHHLFFLKYQVQNEWTKEAFTYIPITNILNKWCQLCAWDS